MTQTMSTKPALPTERSTQTSGARPDAAAVQERIAASFRDLTPADAERVTTKSAGNDIALCGTVRSRATRKEAQLASWRAAGVRCIGDQLG